MALLEISESSNRLAGIAVPRARVERLGEDARAGYSESLEASSIGWHEQQLVIGCHGAAICGARWVPLMAPQAWAKPAR